MKKNFVFVLTIYFHTSIDEMISSV